MHSKTMHVVQILDSQIRSVLPDGLKSPYCYWWINHYLVNN